MGQNSELGSNQEYDDAKQRLLNIADEYAALLAYYTDLTTVIRRNLENKYMLHIGRREHQLFTLRIQILQVKREIALYQAARNRGEKLSDKEVASTIAREFKEHKAKMTRLQSKLEKAEKEHLMARLPESEARKMRKLYLDLVKKLHPDLNPRGAIATKLLWQRVQNAYKSCDWDELMLLSDMVEHLATKPTLTILKTAPTLELQKRIQKINRKKNDLQARIDELMSKPPYSFSQLLASPNELSAKRAELDAAREQLQAHLEEISEMRDLLKGTEK